MYEKEEYKTCEKCGNEPNDLWGGSRPPHKLKFIPGEYKYRDKMQLTCHRCEYEWFVEIEEEE